MGSGNSSRPKSGDRSDFNVKPETLINGGSSISTIDSSHRRKMTDEEKNTNIREADYEDGSLGIMVKTVKLFSISFIFRVLQLMNYSKWQ
jgi:hypothetical protein